MAKRVCGGKPQVAANFVPSKPPPEDMEICDLCGRKWDGNPDCLSGTCGRYL